MDPHSPQIAERITSGEYFERSRAWYRTIYLAPIAERVFFLIIAILAGMVALISFIGVMSFLPLTDHPGLLLRSERLDETIPRLLPIKEEKTPINESLMRFYVTSYIYMREGYSADRYEANYRFIQAQSDAPTFASYAAGYDVENPQSPAAILGQRGKRVVTVRSISIAGESEPKVAKVEFTTEIEGRDKTARTNWTAVLQFYYSDLVINSTVDPATGEDVLATQDPQFQVVDYVLTKAF